MFDHYDRRGNLPQAAKSNIFAPVLKRLLHELSILHEQFDVCVLYLFHGRLLQHNFITKYNYQNRNYESYTRRQNLL
jgi:hypothetical protein